LVQGFGNFWGFPKGHKEKGETDRETALRELYEETHLSCDSLLEDTIFSESYCIKKKKGLDILKKVVYFVGIISHTKVTHQKSEIKKFGWFSQEEASKRIVKNRSLMLEEVCKLLKSK